MILLSRSEPAAATNFFSEVLYSLLYTQTHTHTDLHAQKVANGSQHFFEGNLSIVLAKKKLVTGTRRLSRGDIISEIAHCEAGQG